MICVYALLFFMPSFVQRPLRNLLGAKIDRRAKISAFSFVPVRDVEMAAGSKISSGVFIRAHEVRLGPGAAVRPFVMIKVRRLSLGRQTIVDPMVLVNCTMGPKSALEVGSFSRIFSFSVLEPGEGIRAGDNVAIGQGSLVFCHTSWGNYLEGAPYSRGPVTIGNEAWITARVMVLANSTIGDGAMIGAHSLVLGDVPANALFHGVPARKVRDDAWKDRTSVEKKETRLKTVIEAFHEFHEGRLRSSYEILPIGSSSTTTADTKVSYSFTAIEKRARPTSDVVMIDFANSIAYRNGKRGQEFVDFMNTYGVRLETRPLDALERA